MQPQRQLSPEVRFMEQVEEDGGIRVSTCYQCKKCTNGCPVTFAMDIYPDQVIRLVQMGQRQAVLTCSTIWVCSACETCTTRCPNEVDIAGIMDYLKAQALKSGIVLPQRRTYVFHKVFLDDIRRRGRVFEGGLLPRYMLKSGEAWRKLRELDFKDDLELAYGMLRRGRMALYPQGISMKGRAEIQGLLAQSTR
ncbi:4Fe-4S dicluster domain-containing protein [Desulfobacca acetoxidans]|uniref:Heterodisulfide reductase, C subunit n=1 Tax=Desulfobacca acetoxidans (strain ATCC 700848 / DSM 11109 / ASRB2) TaxID=880072 RepID=F2NGT2_DESAR|nr:4Fe-4S dicluster domain-containing protein [Desulfobacca acetoxidans]AEB08703.1 heterodisulfide reductase, C subunit [Desulfobacca acetoxidans DSM 11109]HAY21282.1 heterodisulfide reductase [Desulfobacterales bacterium]